MEEWRWVPIGLAIALLLVGKFLRGYSLGLGLTFQVCSSVLVRLLAAAVLGWSAAVFLEEPDLLRVALAVVFCALALFSVLSAAALVYGLVAELRQPGWSEE